MYLDYKTKYHKLHAFSRNITNTHTHKHICPGEKGVKLPQSVVSSFHSNNFVNNTDFASSHFKPQITKQIASLPRGV